MRTCAADDCDIKFEPVSPIQLYHSKQCKWRMGIKRRRHPKPNGTNPTSPNGHPPRPVVVKLGKKKSASLKRLLHQVGTVLELTPKETDRLVVMSDNRYTVNPVPRPPLSEKNQPQQDVLFA